MDRNAKLWTAIVASIVLMWVGASWDIAWHLRLENDANSPAHYTNLAGRIVLLGALVWAWRDRRVEERGPLVLALAGMGLAMLAVPVDQTWHAVFGLDLTTWSPPHLLLFYSTAVSCAGVAWLLLAQKGWRPGIRLASLGLSPGALLLLALLLSRAVSPILFPAVFNEHLGVAARNALSGYTLYHVDPALQDYAAKVDDLPYDDLPHLLYPAYTLAAVLAFVFVVRRMTGMAWLASAS
ncbi:MAG TPA: hypothetical protein VI796_00195, partial [Candidatus Thermoplasmatota archaeon]|nr:hypothetical protein [Candidatus Thermoplasmatota archaeon]